jgi:hypothetical protein
MNASYLEMRSENDACIVGLVDVDSLPAREDEEEDPEASAMTERNKNAGILMVNIVVFSKLSAVLSSCHERRSDN